MAEATIEAIAEATIGVAAEVTIEVVAGATIRTAVGATIRTVVEAKIEVAVETKVGVKEAHSYHLYSLTITTMRSTMISVLSSTHFSTTYWPILRRT